MLVPPPSPPLPESEPQAVKPPVAAAASPAPIKNCLRVTAMLFPFALECESVFRTLIQDFISVNHNGAGCRGPRSSVQSARRSASVHRGPARVGTQGSRLLCRNSSPIRHGGPATAQVRSAGGNSDITDRSRPGFPPAARPRCWPRRAGKYDREAGSSERLPAWRGIILPWSGARSAGPDGSAGDHQRGGGDQARSDPVHGPIQLLHPEPPSVAALAVGHQGRQVRVVGHRVRGRVGDDDLDADWTRKALPGLRRQRTAGPRRCHSRHR